jgi:hypothetical protein
MISSDIIASGRYHQVNIPFCDDSLYGNEVISWLTEHGIKWHLDFDFDMNGGQIGYCSFFFRSRKHAIWTALVWLS